MKHSGFTKPTYQEALAKKKASDVKKKQTGRLTRKATKKRTPSKNNRLKAWIKAIPENKAHGSGTYQKRLWRLVSDYVRIRDWHKYRRCVATGKKIDTWQSGQAGHLKPYSTCNGLFKFDVRNIHMQSASSNKWGNRDTWINYEEEVYRRGIDFQEFEIENARAIGGSLRNPDVEIQMLVVLKMMKDLPEKPSYYERVLMLLEQEENFIV